MLLAGQGGGPFDRCQNQAMAGVVERVSATQIGQVCAAFSSFGHPKGPEEKPTCWVRTLYFHTRLRNMILVLAQRLLQSHRPLPCAVGSGRPKFGARAWKILSLLSRCNLLRRHGRGERKAPILRRQSLMEFSAWQLRSRVGNFPVQSVAVMRFERAGALGNGPPPYVSSLTSLGVPAPRMRGGISASTKMAQDLSH